MRAILLSDAHVDGPDDPVQDHLIAFLDAVDADHLVLAGDIFHRWWEGPTGCFPAYRPVVEALARAVARGIRVHLVRGNHDFTVGHLGASTGVKVHDSLRLDLDGRVLHVSHGDEADRSVGYRLARTFLRSAAFSGFLATLGSDRAWRLLGRIAGEPHLVPREIPAARRAQEAVARQALSGGAHVAVFGHLHAPWTVDLPGGTWWTLGAFYVDGQHLVVEGGLLRTARWP